MTVLPALEVCRLVYFSASWTTSDINKENRLHRIKMDSVYTSTIVHAARKRGISVKMIDDTLPIFDLSFNGKSVRCYNGLTDRVGAATFHLANDKGAANRYLRKKGYPVPAQSVYTNSDDAIKFLKKHKSLVVKPVSQWGGRGVSTDITTTQELEAAIESGHRFGDELVLEECVSGIDWRLIFVNCRYVCAIERTPASVACDGRSTIKDLIEKKNADRIPVDPSNVIPLDNETLRCINAQHLTYESVPERGAQITVRRTTNYHTGGTVEIVTDRIPPELICMGTEIASDLGIFVLGVDVLYNRDTRSFAIIELSPDMAISPPEGHMVAEAFLDELFADSNTVL